MKKGAFLVVVAVLAAALLAFVGCGGDDETTALTKAEFTKQANAGCKEHQKEREELFKKVTNELDPSEVTRADQERLISEVLLPPFEKDIENLKSLGAPAGDEQRVEAIIEAMEKAIDKVEAKPLVALRTNSQFSEARAAAVKYGLDDCAI